MSSVSTAYTAAWLDAFRRLAVAKTALDAIELPDGPAKDLGDVIENALRGAADTAGRMIKTDADSRALDILA